MTGLAHGGSNGGSPPTMGAPHPSPDYLPPIFCVSLPAQTERRAAIEKQSATLGLNVTFVDARPGAELTPEELKRYNRRARERKWRSHLSANEIACVISHSKALDAFLASGAAFAVVLEDDATLDAAFPDALRALLDEPERWEIVKLESRLPRRGDISMGALAGPFSLVVTRKWTLGATALLYSRAAALRIRRSADIFDEAFDNIVGRAWRNGFTLQELRPPVVREGDHPSTINIAPGVAMRSANRERRWYRQYCSLMTHAHRLKARLGAIRSSRSA